MNWNKDKVLERQLLSGLVLWPALLLPPGCSFSASTHRGYPVEDATLNGFKGGIAILGLGNNGERGLQQSC